MSNLSELLPTGGGQNAVDFVASGTLSSGQTVALKTDGTVVAITADGATGPPEAGSRVVFESGSTDWPSITYDSTNNKIVVAYTDQGNSSYGTAVVGTVSGTSISFGSPVIYRSAAAFYGAATFDANASKVVVAYRDQGNSESGTAVVGTVSGTSISFGSATVYQSGTANFNSATYDSTNQKVVISYSAEGAGSVGRSVVGTVSGTSISFGSAVQFESGATENIASCYASVEGKIVIAYRDNSNSLYGTAVVGTVSGTSISFGTPVVYNAGDSRAVSVGYDISQQKIVVAYQDYSNSSKGTAVVGTISGTSLSFGTEAVFTGQTGEYTVVTYDSNANKIAIAGMTGTASTSPGSAWVATISGTDISFGTPTTVSSTSFYRATGVFDSSENKIVYAFADSDNSAQGTSVVYATETSASNNTDFIGITAEAISSAATGPVNVYGGINAVQTGLTIGSDYYVQANGSLSTTASSVKVGQAISATTINMMDLT
jgi:hypothetical protein